MYFIEGIRKIYTGENAFARHLALFSLCGIVGLFEAYSTINGIDSLTAFQKTGYIVLNLIFALFFTGYETLFLHERELPDIGLNSFKIAFTKYIFIVFLISVPMFLMSFFSNGFFAFVAELLLAVPLTMIQAGFSYNFQNEETFSLFKKLGFGKYVSLFFKRIFVIILAYLITFSIVFFIFFFGGIVLAIIHKGDPTSIAMAISAAQIIVTKLASFISGIILIYVLSLGTLVWDYELIRIFEKSDICNQDSL